MASSLLIFSASAVVVAVAGIYLTRFADAIADLTGWGRLIVGSVLLAGATSLPELSVDVHAVGLGQPNLAVGDLLGSCLCNLVILAALDISRFSRGRMRSLLASAHALSGMITIVLALIAVIGLLARPSGQLPIGLGVATASLLVVYVLGSRLVYLDQMMAARPDTPGPDQAVLLPATSGMTLARAACGFAAAAVILVAAPYMAEVADALAERSGLARSFVGTTLVAFSTSLPELVASIAALRAGAYDLAIGNVCGSNSFNIALLAVVDAAQPGSLLDVVAPVHAIAAAAVILVTAVAISGQLYQVESRSFLIEPDAALVATLSFAAMGLVYWWG